MVGRIGVGHQGVQPVVAAVQRHHHQHRGAGRQRTGRARLGAARPRSPAGGAGGDAAAGRRRRSGTGVGSQCPSQCLLSWTGIPGWSAPSRPVAPGRRRRSAARLPCSVGEVRRHPAGSRPRRSDRLVAADRRRVRSPAATSVSAAGIRRSAAAVDSQAVPGRPAADARWVERQLAELPAAPPRTSWRRRRSSAPAAPGPRRSTTPPGRSPIVLAAGGEILGRYSMARNSRGAGPGRLP